VKSELVCDLGAVEASYADMGIKTSLSSSLKDQAAFGSLASECHSIWQSIFLK
jgi:hypothetical protein